MSSPSAIYLRMPNWIGDVCMSLPCLDTLLLSGVPVIVCARPWAKDLLAGYKLEGFLPMSGQWRKDRSIVQQHRRHHYRRCAGLLLPDSLSSAMVFRFAGIPCAGYRDDGRSLILRWPVNKPAPNLHAVQSWHYLTRQALSRWGMESPLPGPPARLGLLLNDVHRQQCDQALQQVGLQDQPFVLIAPTATGLHHGKNKVWPFFDALTRRLQAQGHVVAMCPPPAEEEAAKRNAPTAIRIPALKLGAFATLTRLATLVVCNDSGVSHLAAAAHARQVTLFGVTQRERTGPWSDQAVCLGSDQGWPSLEATEEIVSPFLPAPMFS
jgi:heptosyltransferase-2